jgi:hypothetical protein
MPACYEAPGRCIHFGARRLTLTVRGTHSSPPGDDGGVQSALLAALLVAAPRAIEWIETERWTDTPFEEPPAKRLHGDEARAYLETLVCNTLTLAIVEIDYFTGNANPCIDLELDGPEWLEASVRARDLPEELFVRPGHYTVRAVANLYSVPAYRPHLQSHAHAPLWTSPVLALEGSGGEVISLRVGVPEARRGLTDAEAAFFAQPAGRAVEPPPEPHVNLELEIVGRTPPRAR